MKKNLALAISKLSLSYPDSPKSLAVISNFNLDVKKGEFISVIGPSGCGKTTLLYAIAGLKNKQKGKVLINKEKAKSSVEVGVVFQEPLLLPWRNMMENISFGAEMLDLEKLEIEKKTEYLINLMNLGRFKKYFPHQLSGGMKQRVNIARALCVDPNILLLDEPFSNLDSQIRENMQEELLSIYDKTQKTFILVTHNIDEAVFLSDRIVVLSKRPGKIKRVVKVGLKRPRKKSIKDSDPFLKIRRAVSEAIKDEIQI